MAPTRPGGIRFHHPGHERDHGYHRLCRWCAYQDRVAYADILTGLYAVIGIQAALRQRETTGQGQLVDMALFDVMVGTLGNQAMNYLVSGRSPKRMGNSHPNIAPYEASRPRTAG